jgi:uncharacterized membrane protein YeaQ/YmgE (transglycosylase-associated protein family)
MVSGVILPLLILSTIYGVAIFGVFAGLSKMGISSKKRVFLSSLIFGILTGFLVAWAWPSEGGIFINIFPVLLGDEVYSSSIVHFGDPSSLQAHYTIPWILRIPQVYVIVSIIFWGLIGLVTQFIYNRKTK